MSLSLRIGLIFTTIVILTVLVASANWLGTMHAIRRQNEILEFSEGIKQDFNNLASEEKFFSITPLPLYSQKVFTIISSIQQKITFEKNLLTDGPAKSSLESLLFHLDSYEIKFKKYSESLIELFTIQSRLSRDLEKLLSTIQSTYPPPSPTLNIQGISFSLLDVFLNHMSIIENTSVPNIQNFEVLENSLEKLLKTPALDDRSLSDIDDGLYTYRAIKAIKTYTATAHQFFNLKTKVYYLSEPRMLQLSVLRDKIDEYIEKENIRVALRSKRYLEFALLITLFSAILSVSATILLSRIIVRPIERLKNSALEVIKGNFNTAVTVDSTDEIGHLSHIFNKMTTNLRELFSKLEKHQNHLESLVEERTVKLLDIISEKEMAEKSLLASQKNIQRIIDQIPVGIVLWDKNFRVLQWNPASKQIFSYNHEEVAGKHASFFAADKSETIIDDIFSTLTHDKVDARCNIYNKVKDDSVILCDWYNTPFLDSTGQINGIISIIEDITSRNRNEKELLKIAKLQSAGILAGGIAHDFNNILTAILGTINLSLLDDNLSSKTRSLLVSSEKACLRSKALTSQLLTFAKGGYPIKETTTLREIIIDSATFSLHGGNISVEFDIDENLLPVEVDKGQFSQVIQNIIINSRHAMSDGGKILISCHNIRESLSPSEKHPKQSCVKISITDQGIGIANEIIDKIFDPYFSTKQEGSGLGLAITHSIVVKHGGRIFVDSELGVGTTFHILLPASAQQVIESDESASDRFQVVPWRVLVMDDEKMVLSVMKNMLEKQHHNVTTSSNSSECFDIFSKNNKNNPFDLVILDLTIPGGKGGRETASEILALAPSAKIVVTSGYSNDPIMASYQDHGFVANLAKPFTSDEVFSLIYKIQNEIRNS